MAALAFVDVLLDHMTHLDERRDVHLHVSDPMCGHKASTCVRSGIDDKYLSTMQRRHMVRAHGPLAIAPSAQECMHHLPTPFTVLRS